MTNCLFYPKTNTFNNCKFRYMPFQATILIYEYPLTVNTQNMTTVYVTKVQKVTGGLYMHSPEGSTMAIPQNDKNPVFYHETLLQHDRTVQSR